MFFQNDPKRTQHDPKIIQTWSTNDPKSIPIWVQSETEVSPTWIQTDPKTWAGKVRQGKKTRGTFLKDSSVSDCVLCRILVLCAWYLSYVSDTCLMCRILVLCVWYLSYVQGSSLMCRGQSLVVLFFYGVKVLWRERSMAWTLYDVNALWRERSMTWTLYDVNALCNLNTPRGSWKYSPG